MDPKAFRFLPFVLVLCLCLGFSLPSRAQVAGGSLSGTITDPQGAAVVGAKISAKNAATGVTSETTTNSSGAYSLVNLLPANYDLSATAPGFRTAVSKVTITVGSQQTMNFPLVVGEVAQTVEVTGAAPVIELSNATISGNVESQQIVELPLNGRDWASLATLEPGVVSVRVHEQVTQPGGNLRGLGNQMTIDGNRPTQNVYRLNGVIVNDYSNAGPGNVLGASVGVDAIQEFSVLTSNYSAEYGFTSGGVINAITKSGTNSFHGSAFEFVRNKAFDSSNYLSTSKPPFVRNQFGASGGWKVLKDRAFLFGAYEGLRQRKGIPGSAKVLTPNARLGILNDSSGNPITPTQGIANGWLTSTGACRFANSTNLAPGQAALCVDNFTKSFTDALDPLPTCDVTSPTAKVDCLIGPSFNSAKYLFAGAQAVGDNYFTIRGDVKLTEKDSVNSSYYRDHSTWSKPSALNNSRSGFILPNQAASIEETHIFSSSLVNSVRLGYSQSVVLSPGLEALNSALLDTQFGITSSLSAPGLSQQSGAGGLPGVTSFGGFNKSGGFSDWVQNYQVFDDMSLTKGNHTWKFGFEFVRNHDDLLNGNGNGSVSFASIATFLLNEPLGARMPTSPPFTAGNTKHYNRNSVFGGYVQDDWKMRPNLTVNMGVRYEMSTIPFETNKKFRILPTLTTDPGGCKADLNGLPIDSTCTALSSVVFTKNPTLKNFEPRVGFAWDPFNNGKTSVRGGFGIFDVLPMPFMFGLNALQGSPAGAELDLTPANLATQQGSFTKGLAAIAAGLQTGATGRWQYSEQAPHRNYVMQWNANVQRQITTNTSVTLAYAGSRAVHNPFQTDTLNTVFPKKTSAGWLFPTSPTTIADPSVPLGTSVACSSALFLTTPSVCALLNPNVPNLMLSTAFFSQSTYNSFQANVQKKMSHGLQLEASFTWQRSMDNSSGSFAGDNYSSNPTAATPWWDGSITKGLSDFNITRNLTINWQYQIPTPEAFKGSAGWIARGWGVGGLIELSDGVPMWPLIGLASDPLGQINQEPMSIPDLAPGCTPQNAVQPGNIQYLKASCFIYPTVSASFDPGHTLCDQAFSVVNNLNLPANSCPNLLGHLQRNSIIGPGLFNVDMSFIKDNHIRKISENFNIQFRAEFFNIFNRTNFAPPTDNLVALDPDPQNGFGSIDQPTQVDMREIQFALKLVW